MKEEVRTALLDGLELEEKYFASFIPIVTRMIEGASISDRDKSRIKSKMAVLEADSKTHLETINNILEGN